MSKAPLYPRVLRLRHIHPSGWQRLLFWEGSFVVAGLLVLADVASAWTLLVLPVAVALVVKGHDLLTGLLRPAASPASEPAVGTVAIPRFTDLPPQQRVDLPAFVVADFSALTETALTLARTLIAEQGGFPPYATVLTRSGKRAVAGLSNEDDTEAADPAEALDDLHACLVAQRGALRAVAVVADAQGADDAAEDVVLVELGHSSGPSLLLVAPYTLSEGTVRFGSPTALECGSTVWGDVPVDLPIN